MLYNLKELYRYRELLWYLTLRDIRVRYKQALLGVIWAILQPLSMMLIFTVVFVYVLKVSSEGIPYPLFSYSALLPWMFFANSLNTGSLSLIEDKSLITKIYFPREIIPLSSMLSSFFDFCVASVIFVFLMIFYKVGLTINAVWFLILLPIQIFLTIGLVLWLSSINVFYRDVRYVIPLMLQIWMYATPIIYPISQVPEKVRGIYMLNPMAALIDAYRKILLKGEAPDLKTLFIALVISLLFLTWTYASFKKKEEGFADII